MYLANFPRPKCKFSWASHIVLQLIKRLLVLCVARQLITVFRASRLRPCTEAKESSPSTHTNFSNTAFQLWTPSHPCPRLPNGLFPLMSLSVPVSLPFLCPDQNLECISRFCHACYISHHIDLISLIICADYCQLWRCWLLNSLQSHVTSPSDVLILYYTYLFIYLFALGVWSGFSWLRIGTGGGILWIRWWTSDSAATDLIDYLFVCSLFNDYFSETQDLLASKYFLKDYKFQNRGTD
jgi:hypothetical protein